ncbi:class I SAM-dependent methyltransferase [Streptomyces purpureus]|uniref:class I SAM-dependent methyltransferase n=1 Tax=Streptomyces purpureus TaxID=1951 RepID=UPI00037A8737|nr:class I SAM-dependent methyltransferase [Streptomyces purpureus]
MTDHVAPSTRHFYDELAADYDLMYADWGASVGRQGAALDRKVTEALGPGRYDILDCSCGIGTQALGLAGHGHRVTGTDLSPAAVARAREEAAARGLQARFSAADMRALPFPDRSFDVVVCADNSLPHLLTAEDVRAAVGEQLRVLRPGGLLLLSTRPYDELLRERPRSTPPGVRTGPGGRAISFQLWHWHDDGEHYELELFQLLPNGATWATKVHRATYWALPRGRTSDFVAGAGFEEVRWSEPGESGFFQPLLTARRPGGPATVTGHDDT